MYSVVKLFDRNNKKSIKFYKLKFDKLKKKNELQTDKEKWNSFECCLTTL